MPLTKGRTNNPNGRPPGAKNKVNTELRSLINNFLNAEFKTVKRAFKKLDPKDQIKAYTDLLNYGLPKLQATSHDINFENMTEEQLDHIINQLKAGAENEQTTED